MSMCSIQKSLVESRIRRDEFFRLIGARDVASFALEHLEYPGVDGVAAARIESASRRAMERKAKNGRQKVVAGRAREIFPGLSRAATVWKKSGRCRGTRDERNSERRAALEWRTPVPRKNP